MKPGGGPLTLIVAYQRPPFSTWAVSAKMHHRVPVSFAAFLGGFFTEDLGSGVSNSGRYVIRVSKLNGRCMHVMATIMSLHCGHKKRV